MTVTAWQIGTAYAGKEPFEYVHDVLRAVVRSVGVECGFEPCLTSRPFTARTYVVDSPGAMVPGRLDLDGADRVSCDLADGLAALETAGYAATVADAAEPPTPADGQAVIAGPLPVPARWASPVDRLVLGDVWRYVIVAETAGDSVVCLDPVFGGHTSIDRTELSQPGVRAYLCTGPVSAPDLVRLARFCLARGGRWRADADGDDRDDRGLATMAADPQTLLAGGAPRRLRPALANHALHAMRTAALLGFCGGLTTNQLALADLLAETVTWARRAMAAVRDDDAMALGETLRRLSATAGVTGELLRREAS